MFAKGVSLNAMRVYKLIPIVSVGILIVGAIGYVISVREYYQGITPLANSNIQNIIEQMGFQQIREIENNGEVFYVVEGPIPPSYVLASGPALYFFDSRGRLVEWIRDSGDQPDAVAIWNLSSSRKVPVEYVLRVISEQEKGS
jgi:hypothetical protein